MLPNDSFLRMRRLSTVPRWAVVPTLQRQNVAEHTFHVCSLALWLAAMHERWHLGTLDVGMLMVECLRHDESEAVTGDIAAPSKSFLSGAIKEFEANNGMPPCADGDYRVIMKCADLLEAWLFLREEQAMGNTRINKVLADIIEKFQTAWDQFEYRTDQNKIESWAVLHNATRIFLGDLIRHPGLEVTL